MNTRAPRPDPDPTAVGIVVWDGRRNGPGGASLDAINPNIVSVPPLPPLAFAPRRGPEPSREAAHQAIAARERLASRRAMAARNSAGGYGIA